MNVDHHALRLAPGADLRISLQEFAISKNIKAGWIVTCLGSLTKYAIRFADEQQGSSSEGHFEILSVTGTLSVNGSHLHIAIADHKGNCLGGHLLEGSIIYTTAEIIIAETKALIFKREKDSTTGYNELSIEEMK